MRRRILLSGGGGIDPITGRGTIGDYEVVDLGLSNGLLFATCNVGATKEEGYGNYYQYGKGAAQYAATSGDSYYKGMEDPLASSADTATQVMGSGWRMPTKDEIEDLSNKTNYEWTTINGIKGHKYTSKTNPNAYVFFLPLASTPAVVSKTKIITASFVVLRLTIVTTPTTCTSTVMVMKWYSETTVTTGSLCVACMQRFENLLESSIL